MIKTVQKVWGSEKIIVNDAYCGKILYLKKGYRSSLHSHRVKDEHFYVMSGKLLMEIGHNQRVMLKGDDVHINPGVNHRFTGLEDSEIIEFSTHHFNSDSYRLEESGKIVDGKELLEEK